MVSTNQIFTGFVVGAAAGAALGIMMAPKTGKETREMLRHRAGKVQNQAGNYLGSIRNKINAKTATA